MAGGDNTLIIRRYYEEAWNAFDLSVVEELVATAYQPGGPEGEKRLVSGAHAAFPNIHFAIDDLLAAERDSVVARWTASGSHLGRFRGIPPTGREVTWSGITIYRLSRSQLVAGWSKSDQLGLLQQLGAEIAAPGRA